MDELARACGSPPLLHVPHATPHVRPHQRITCGHTIRPEPPCVNTDVYLVMVVAGSSRPGNVQAPFIGQVRKQIRRSLEAITVSVNTLYGSHADLCSRRLGAG